jgi:hypothetical protein
MRTVPLVDDLESERAQGDAPVGIGPEIFRERLQQLANEDLDSSAEITLQDQKLFLADIESVDAEPDGHRSLVRMRNGLILGGITGAAIVAALATVRYRRHHRK